MCIWPRRLLRLTSNNNAEASVMSINTVIRILNPHCQPRNGSRDRRCQRDADGSPILGPHASKHGKVHWTTTMASSQNKQGDRQHIDAFFYRTGNVHLSHLLYQHSIFNSATTLALTDACTITSQTDIPFRPTKLIRMMHMPKLWRTNAHTSTNKKYDGWDCKNTGRKGTHLVPYLGHRSA